MNLSFQSSPSTTARRRYGYARGKRSSRRCQSRSRPAGLKLLVNDGGVHRSDRTASALPRSVRWRAQQFRIAQRRRTRAISVSTTPCSPAGATHAAAYIVNLDDDGQRLKPRRRRSACGGTRSAGAAQRGVRALRGQAPSRWRDCRQLVPRPRHRSCARQAGRVLSSSFRWVGAFAAAAIGVGGRWPRLVVLLPGTCQAYNRRHKVALVDDYRPGRIGTTFNQYRDERLAERLTRYLERRRRRFCSSARRPVTAARGSRASRSRPSASSPARGRRGDGDDRAPRARTS